MGAEKRGKALLRLGVATVCAFAAQCLLTARRASVWDGIALYALAMAILAGAWRERAPARGEGLFREVIRGLWQALDRSALRLAMALVGCALVASAAFAAPGRHPQQPYMDLLALWLVGLAAFGGAFVRWGAFSNKALWRRALQPEGVGVGLIVLGTILLRAVAVEYIPSVLSGDEASFGLEALRVLRRELGNPFATGWLSHPSLYFFIQAAFIRWFGATTAALRLSSAFISGGSVLLLYLLAKRFWGRGVAFMAALYFAVYHYAIHFGRLGLNNIWDTFWALGSLYALTRGLQERHPGWMALGGLFTGMAIYFYLGARLVPVLAGVYILLWAWQEKGFWRAHGAHLILFGVMALLAALPLLAFFRLHPEQFTARWRWVGIFPSGWVASEMARTGRSVFSLLWEQFLKSILAFNAIPDPTFWYRPERPLLLWMSAVWFVWGVTYCLVHWRKRPCALLLIWFLGVVIFGGVLLENPPSSPRFVMAIPPVVMMIALGIRQAAGLVSDLWGGRKAVTWIMALVLLGLCTYESLHFYFGVYTPRRMFSDENTAVADAIGKYLRAKGPGTTCFLAGPPRLYFGHATIPYLAQGVTGVDIVEPLTDPQSLDIPAGAVFIFLPERAGELDALWPYYPQGTIWRYHDTRGNLQFIAYELP